MTEALVDASMSIGDPNQRYRNRIDATLADRWRQVRMPRPLQDETRRVAEALGYSLPPIDETLNHVC